LLIGFIESQTKLLWNLNRKRQNLHLDTIVARTEGCTHAAKVWYLSIVHGPVSVAPCPTCQLTRARFATVSKWRRAEEARGSGGVGVPLWKLKLYGLHKRQPLLRGGVHAR
jgi:hypothetical protein